MVLLGALGCAPGDAASGSGDLPALGAVTELPAPSAPISNTPFLTISADSTPILSWTFRDADSTASVRLARWNGSSWDSTRTVTSGRTLMVNWADFPAITTLGNGDLAAHWLEREGTIKYAYGIRVARSTDGGRSWSTPVTPHTDGLEAEHGFVSLWADGADGVGLVWLDGRKSAMKDSAREMTIRSAVITPAGTLTQESVIDARSCDCCQTGTTATASGRVLVYRDRTAEEIRDIAIVRRTADGWSAPQIVHADQWHYPGCPVNGPQAEARGDTVFVAWYTAANDTARVLVARSTDGGATFGTPVRVDDGTPLGRVDLVLDDAGRPVVAWMEEPTPGQAEVRLRRVDPANGTRSASTLLAKTAGARQSGFPRIVRSRDALFASWTTVEGGLQVHVAKVSLSP